MLSQTAKAIKENNQKPWLIAVRDASLVAILTVTMFIANKGYQYVSSNLGETIFAATIMFCQMFFTSLCITYGLKGQSVSTGREDVLH